MKSIGGRKAGYSSRICLVPWDWGQRVRRNYSRSSAVELEVGVDLKERRQSEAL